MTKSTFKINTLQSIVYVRPQYRQGVADLLDFLHNESKLVAEKAVDLPTNKAELERYLADMEATAICKFRLCLSWRAEIGMFPDGRVELRLSAYQYEFAEPIGYSLQ